MRVILPKERRRLTTAPVLALIPVLSGVAVFALCALPLISAYCGGGESCTLVIRGYNLMEFSGWGAVPMLAPLLVPAILFGNQPKAAREAELVLLFLADVVCYAHSLSAARIWLETVGDSAISVHPGMILCPLGFAGLLAAAKGVDLIAARGKTAGESEA